MDEIKRLQACVNNLTRLLALPATWLGGKQNQVATVLLDALHDTLRLDLAYVQLKNGEHPPVEILRPFNSADSLQQMAAINETLKTPSSQDPQGWPLEFQIASCEGRLSMVAFQLGLNAQLGVLVVGSRRAGFPEASETMLLNVAATQATIGLLETRDRNHPQQALARSQFYLSEGQRLAHTGSWAFTPNGFFNYWSDELFRIYGLDPRKGSPSLEEYLAAIHPQDREFMADTIRRMHVEISGCDVKKRIVRPDGEIRIIRCVGVPVLENGVLQGFIGTAMDVTEQEHLTQELRRREAYLAEAQRLSQTGSFGWKPASGDIVWSDETHRIFDADLKTKPTTELVLSRAHPEDRPSIQRLIDQATREAKDWNLEHRLLMPDGTLKYLRVVARAVRDELHDEVEYVGAVMDITAAKQSLQALERAYAEIGRLKDELEKENIVLREEIDRSSMFEEIVGESPAVQALLRRVAKVAPTDSTVLISGETGTGKELIARAIHKRSRRAEHAFVSVNCAAIPSSLIASELFGHEKGAFTGAIQRRLGRFELAEGGTIFLDEIGELPAETQISLLRVLQEREFERVGGSKIIRADVRVIAATNRDLQAAIHAGTFRSDLYYRLNVFPIEVPPLRKRKQDIPLLLGYFIDRYSSKTGKKIGSIDSATLERLIAYSWPGNVRELQNVIERSIIVCETERFMVDESWLAPLTAATDQSVRPFFKLSPSDEKKAIEAALSDARGRVSGPLGAAARLGLPPSTLDSKIKALKINKYRYRAVS